MKISLRSFLCLSLFFQLLMAHGQEIDAGFSTKITGTLGLSVKAGAAQPDGKLIIAGAFDVINGWPVQGFARLNSDGSLDQTFVTGTGFDSEVADVAILSNGKILVGGYFTRYNNEPAPYLIRLNADGTKDASFNVGTGFSSAVFDVAVQQDGKILVAGHFTKYNNATANNMVRLNADGSLDNTFSTGSGIGTESYIHDIEVQRDGKILIGGSFLNFNGQAKPRLVRLNANGSLDATFNPSGSGPDYLVTCISIQVVDGEDRIVIGGYFDKYNGVTSGRIARLKPDGTYDTEFQVGAGFGTAIVLDVLAYFDEIFVGVSTKFAKVNKTGTVITSFSQSSTQWLGDYGLGQIAVGGNFAQISSVNRSGLAIVSSGGTPLSTFNPVLALAGTIRTVKELSDGKLLIGGDFTNVDGHAVGNIARLNADGTFDNTFNTGTGFSSGPAGAVDKIVIQSDGKILVGGWFDKFNGTGSNELARLTRLNSDGTLDGTFNKTLYLGSPVRDLISLPDNKIIIGISSNGTVANQVIRFNANGSIDNSFNAGAPVDITQGFDGLQMLSDGRIVFAQPGTSETVLKVLQPDGTIGATLATIPGVVKKMITGPDNVLYAATGGNSSGASASFYRVDANGSVFKPNVSLHTSVPYGIGGIYAMALSNNTLLTGGYFDRIYYSGTSNNFTQPWFAAFDQNGALLAGATASFDASVSDIFSLSQGRILVTGNFSKVNDVQKKKYVMLKTPANAPQAPSDMVGAFKTGQVIELSWSDNSTNESAFEIQRASRQGNDYVTIRLAKPNETTWKDTLANNAGSGFKYRVRATNFAGASAYTESQLITGVERGYFSSHALYPNPTSGIVYLNKEAIHPATIVSVLDISGQIKFTAKATESIDLSFLPSGPYILKLQDASSSTVTRLVKIN